jgi:mono/diheme cytochrome c family protein
LAALYLPKGSAPSPFVGPGRFTSTWEGYLNLKINDTFVFSFSGWGSASMEINGKTVLENTGPELRGGKSGEIDLRKGENTIRIRFVSPLTGDARFRLYWWNFFQPREPVPPGVFTCEGNAPDLVEGETRRTGRWLFSTGRCIQCHLPETPVPSDAMPEIACDSPVLTGIGDRLNEGWMAQWLRDPTSIRDRAQMPTMLHGDDSVRGEQARNIAAFLAALSQNVAGNAEVIDLAGDLDRVDAGEVRFEELGCFTCHTLPGDDLLVDDPRLSLAHVKTKWKPSALVAFLQNPAKDYQWTRMPDFQLTDAEALELAAYLIDRSEDPSVSDEVSGDGEMGRQLLVQVGCLNCHELEGVESELAVPALGQITETDDFKGCLDPSSTERVAPYYDYDDEERSAVAAFVKNDLASLNRRAWNEYANRQFAALQCVACHAREDEGDRWAVILAGQIETTENNPYEDGESEDDLEADFADDFSEDYGGESTVGNQRNIHEIRPPLYYAGEKLNPDWMEMLIAGELPYKPRPRLRARMPSYVVYARGLAIGSSLDHGFPPVRDNRPPVDPELARVGQQLIQMERLGCISCHAVGDAGGLSGPAAEVINFQYTAQRLRKHYFERYVLDPQRALPGTMMPKYPDEDFQSPIKDVFDGDARKQFEAIWHHMRSLSQ